jgi:hypothetical protein
MSSRRFHLHGLFAVLLALMAQLGAAATVPRLDPIGTAAVLCHPENDGGGAPSRAPSHSSDCLVCPLCVALHAQPVALLPVADAPMPRSIGVVLKTELPPPSTAPPAPHRPPSQPRAPPTFS